MKITILCVGKIKEKYFRDAIAEYEKRLGRYCKLEIVEVADEKTPDGASEAEEQQIRRKEGERLLKIFRGKELLRHCPCNQRKNAGFCCFIGKSQ